MAADRILAAPRAAATRGYAAALWALSLAFVLRVAAQALQRWAPQRFLPPFEEFQGSSLSYDLLLASQLAIIAVMSHVSWRVSTGALARSRRIGRVLAWIGSLYMAGSIARVAIGVLVPGAPAWFTAWISGAFHLVLAAFVLTLASFHLQLPPGATAEPR
jgi:hypothetical protein